MYDMDTSSLSLIGFGVVVIVGSVLMYIVSLVSMKETSFEDVLEEQRQKKIKEDKQRSQQNKQKRDQYKKKFELKKKKAHVGNGKLEKMDAGVSPMHEVQIKETPEIVIEEPVKAEVKTKVKGKVTKKQESSPQLKDSPKPSHPILKSTADIKESPQNSAFETTEEMTAEKPQKPLPQAKQEEQKKTESNRPRTVSFSDDVSEKAENEPEKSKKKKKKADIENENILVTNLRDALLSERDVQNILTLIKQKYGIDVGGGNKIRDLQSQLDQAKKQLSKKAQAYDEVHSVKQKDDKRIKELTQDLNTEKIKFSSLDKVLQEKEKESRKEFVALQTKTRAEISQLKETLKKTADYDEICKTAEKLKSENAIYLVEIQKNAALAGEMSRTTADLQQTKFKLQESQRKCNEFEAKMADVSQHAENINHQQAENESKYSHELQEMQIQMQQMQKGFASLELDYQKVNCELQSNQSHTSSMMLQVTKLTEEKEALEEKLTESHTNIDNRDAEIQGVKEKNVQLSGEIESLKQQTEQMNSHIESLTKAVKDDANTVSKSVQDKEDEVSKVKEDLENAKAASKKLEKEVEKLKKKNDDLRKRSWTAMDNVSALEKSIPDKIAAAQKDEQQKLLELESNIKEILTESYPGVSSSEKDFTVWVKAFLAKATQQFSNEAQTSSDSKVEDLEKEASQLRKDLENQEVAASSLREKVKELETSLGEKSRNQLAHEEMSKNTREEMEKAKSECERYKNILNSTEEILNKLQSSVEVEESVWKKKVEEAYLEATEANKNAESLQKEIEKLQSDNSSYQEKLIEKDESFEELKKEISELQGKIEETEKSSSNTVEDSCHIEQVAQTDVPLTEPDLEQQEEPTDARPPSPIHQISKHQQCDGTPTKTVSCQSDSPVQVQYTDACTDTEAVLKQQDMDGFLVIDHVALAETNKSALENGYEDELAKLKERLEKEKMLTKNLGQAATKLQTVLKQTQEQLNQEREKNGDLESKLTNPDAVQKEEMQMEQQNLDPDGTSV